MAIEKIKVLLEQLQQEVKNTKQESDGQEVGQLQEMEDSISQILNVDNLQHQDVYDGIMQMEYSFLTKYPVASSLLREVVEILSKAGI